MVHPQRVHPYRRGVDAPGVSVLGSRVLEVKGRKSGESRQTPVNLLEFDGGGTSCRRGARAMGAQRTRGRERRVARREQAETLRAQEVDDDDKIDMLHAYLSRWKVEVGVFFDGRGPDSSEDELRGIAPRHPAFTVLQPA